MAARAWAYQGEECYEIDGELICYGGDDDDSGGSGGDGGDGGSRGGEPWPGYSDGRLNPDPGEYYSVWCDSNLLKIYRVVPATELIKTVEISEVVALAVGASLDLGDFMTLVRNTEDTITIYGSNGNGAPEPGQKAFSLSECIARNGGLPEPDDSGSPPAGGDTDEPAEEPQETEAVARRREAEELLDFCFDSYEFLQDGWLLAGCLNDALAEYRDVLTGDELVSLVVMVMCLNVLVGTGVAPIGIVLFLRWYRRWLRKHEM